MVSVVVLLSVISIQPVAALSKSEQIVREATTHIGTPYQWGGTTPDGFDCSGFIHYVYNKAGLSLPRTAAEQFTAGIPVDKQALQTGDLVFFETYKPGPSHSGIYVGNGQFIHASSSAGITISSLSSSYWEPKWLGATRIIDDEDSLQQVDRITNGEKVKAEVSSPVAPLLFSDINESYWAYSSIRQLADKGIVTGYEDGTFLPNQPITRAETAAFLVNALGLQLNGQDAVFTDVSSTHEHADAIAAVNEARLITGNSKKEFMPDEPLSRQHMAVIFDRAFELIPIGKRKEFQDVPTHHMYYDQIQKLAVSGITTGNKHGDFEPQRETTRAHFSVFLERALDL